MDGAQYGAQRLEEFDALDKSRHCSPAPGSKKNMLCHWKWKLLRFLEDVRGRRSQYFVVCLHVHRVDGLPPEMNGQVLVVGWKTDGCKGEHTLPVRVCGGAAAFEEIFLQYCADGGKEDVLRSFTVWVSLVDAADCDLGTFHVDLRELRTVESSGGSKLAGKTMSFLLEGRATGGALNLSVFCRVADGEDPSIIGVEKAGKCFSCLPNIGCLRSRSVTYSARRMPSLRSDQGFITIENSAAVEHCARADADVDDGGSGFITIEKGSTCASLRRSPSELLANTGVVVVVDGDDEKSGGGPEGVKACLVMDLGGDQEIDGDKVEDDFLRMLEEKYGKAGDGESWRKGTPEEMSWRLSADLDLDCMIKEANMELSGTQLLRKKNGPIGGASLEREEFEELAKKWRSDVGSIYSSSGSSAVHAFGSPV